MRVKVTPPYPGAGSFETEVCESAMSNQLRIGNGESGESIPKSWCTEIPSITPEPGDIVEDYQGTIFVFDPSRSATPFKVSKILARKPKEYMQAKDAIYKFASSLVSDDDEQAAYNKFLSAILGVPYGRVEG